MRISTIPLVALALGACQQVSDQEQAQSNTSGIDRNYTAEVLHLSDSSRNAVLLRAIRNAGFSCQGVTGSERVADAGAAPTWRATCNDGTPHLVQVAPDGTATVLSRTGS